MERRLRDVLGFQLLACSRIGAVINPLMRMWQGRHHLLREGNL